MVTLSVERINRTSPYKVSEGSVGFVEFKTDSGVVYSVGFVPTDLFISAETYQFYLTNVNNKKSPRDVKLRNTIMAVVLDFFLSSDTAMLYICDTGDMRQSMRARLFRFWASGYSQYDQFSVTSGSVTDEDGVRNYATLIIRNDHPKKKEVVNEFMDTIQTLNEKPNR